MSIEIGTAVVGGGVAGLTVGVRLAERGIPFLIIDDHARVGDSWRERYRSLRLFTPRRLLELGGLRLDVGYFAFPTGAQLADYLERLAEHFALPLRMGARVTSLMRTADGRFRLALSPDATVVADRVIVTAGAHRLPVTPPFATAVADGIRQLHSVTYRGPEQLADGPVLVVGAGNSGTDIALEAAATGHAVTLAGRHPGQVPVDIDTPIGNLLAGIFIAKLRNMTIDTEEGRAMRAQTRGHGINLVRNKLRDLERAGIMRVGRIAGVDRDGHPVLADATVVEASTVVWCTGSRPELDWIDIDGALDDTGHPHEHRGVSTTVPGLAFVGLDFQYSAASATIMGMGVDADHVVVQLFAATAATLASARPA